MKFEYEYYTFQTGDTLVKMSEKTGVSVGGLVALNPILRGHPKYFEVGMQVKIKATRVDGTTTQYNTRVVSALSSCNSNPNAKFSLNSASNVNATTSSASAGAQRESSGADLELLKQTLHQLQTQVMNFGNSYINDATVRQNYVDKIKKMSEEILQDVKREKATAKEGAEFANKMRNCILEEARANSSSIGRAHAEAAKAAGKSIEDLIQRYSKKLFGETFGNLSPIQKQSIYKEMIKASGRSSPKFTTRIPKWKLLGKGCVLFTVGITTYNIWTEENKIYTGLRDGIALGGGFFGGAIAGGATGLVCGPGAPVCSTVLFIVGGIVGTLAAEGAMYLKEDELYEFSEWLGEYAE